jgi:large subunit ribosomal protein L16
MLLQPRKMKYRKWHKGRSKGVESKGTELAFGSFGLKSLGTKWIKANQLEAARIAIVRTLKRKGKLWIRIFPHKPVTSKGTEVPMGGGKGNVSHYVFPIRPGRIIFELDGIKEDIAREALRKAAAKLPIKTKFVKKEK